MTVEPLSSAMTYQAQPYTTQTVQKVPQSNMDVAENTGEVLTDNTTAAVNKAETSNPDADGGSYNGSTGQTNQQEQIKKAIDAMNSKMSNSEAVFGIHEPTNRVMIKIIDKTTKKVIKELPPEKTLDMIAKVWEMAGILVDAKR